MSDRQQQPPKKHVNVLIDEFTITFRHKEIEDAKEAEKKLKEESKNKNKLETQIVLPSLIEFQNKSIYFISDLVEISGLTTVFGDLIPTENNQKSYNTSYTLKYADFISFSYHTEFPNFGISFRISATTLSKFLASKTGSENFEYVFRFINFLYQFGFEANFIPRLSRIDTSADFFNFNLTLDKFYKDILKGKIERTSQQYTNDEKPFYKTEEMTETDPTTYGGIDGIQTIYFGDVKSGRCALRMYDKKVEQTSDKSKNFLHLEKANECESWIRLEVVNRKEYASQIGQLIYSQVNSYNDFTKAIAKWIVQHYYFFYLDKSGNRKSLVLFSKELDKIAEKGSKYNLKAEQKTNHKKNDIVNRLFSPQIQNTFYLIRQLEGDIVFADLIRQAINYNMEIHEKKISKDVKSLAKKLINEQNQFFNSSEATSTESNES